MRDVYIPPEPEPHGDFPHPMVFVWTLLLWAIIVGTVALMVWW